MLYQTVMNNQIQTTGIIEKNFSVWNNYYHCCALIIVQKSNLKVKISKITLLKCHRLSTDLSLRSGRIFGIALAGMGLPSETKIIILICACSLTRAEATNMTEETQKSTHIPRFPKNAINFGIEERSSLGVSSALIEADHFPVNISQKLATVNARNQFHTQNCCLRLPCCPQ